MKRLAIILLTLLLLMGCSMEPAVVDLGGKPVTYDSTEEMEAAATLVVTGEVLSCDSRINQTGSQVTSALTLSQFKIINVDKGDVQPGQIINIWQNSAFDTESNTIYQFGNASPVTEGNVYTLYLCPREAGSEYYTPVSYQGILPAPET